MDKKQDKKFDLYLKDEYLNDINTAVKRTVSRWWLEKYALDREDLEQECFISILKSIGTFDKKKGTMNTWASTVAQNTIITLYKKQFAQKRGLGKVPKSLNSDRSGNKDSDNECSWGMLLEKKETEHDKIVYYFPLFKKEFSKIERMVFALYRKKYTYGEIAEIINNYYKKKGIDKETNRKRVDNTLLRIKGKLKAKIYENPSIILDRLESIIMKEPLEARENLTEEEREKIIESSDETTLENSPKSIIKCKECGEDFTKESKKQKFCSENCRKKYFRGRQYEEQKDDIDYKERQKKYQKKWYKENKGRLKEEYDKNNPRKKVINARGLTVRQQEEARIRTKKWHEKNNNKTEIKTKTKKDNTIINKNLTKEKLIKEIEKQKFIKEKLLEKVDKKELKTLEIELKTLVSENEKLKKKL